LLGIDFCKGMITAPEDSYLMRVCVCVCACARACFTECEHPQ